MFFGEYATITRGHHPEVRWCDTAPHFVYGCWLLCSFAKTRIIIYACAQAR